MPKTLTAGTRLAAATLTACAAGAFGTYATAATGPGTVFAAAYGTHTNAQGEQCLVLPGVNTDITVPAAPAPAPAG